MSIDDFKSLDEIPEKEMLKLLFANQIQIMRQISLLQWHLDRKENNKLDLTHFNEDVRMFVSKTDNFVESINEYLSQDDLEKGILRV